uniref:Uncharacterized protein n=1 Tax=Sus scrofa TaxID=9823 RepID=A0A8D1IB48_PIG
MDKEFRGQTEDLSLEDKLSDSSVVLFPRGKGEARIYRSFCKRTLGGQNIKRLLLKNTKDTCTPMCIATQFTIAKTWKQPKYPLTDEWIKEMWYIYTMDYYSTIKKNKIMPFAATCMQLEILILSEVRKRKTNTI